MKEWQRVAVMITFISILFIAPVLTNDTALIIAVIIAFCVVFWQHQRQLKEGSHPYLSIERISKLKTKEERRIERKRKRK